MQFKFIYTNSALVSIRQAAVTKWKKSESLLVVSDSLWHRGLLPAKLLCPGKSPGKDAGVDCHFLLQVIFLTQASNPGLLHCRQILYPSEPPGKPKQPQNAHFWITSGSVSLHLDMRLQRPRVLPSVALLSSSIWVISAWTSRNPREKEKPIH